MSAASENLTSPAKFGDAYVNAYHYRRGASLYEVPAALKEAVVKAHDMLVGKHGYKPTKKRRTPEYFADRAAHRAARTAYAAARTSTAAIMSTMRVPGLRLRPSMRAARATTTSITTMSLHSSTMA